MAVEVRPKIVVRRDRADVAAYMFDPEHDLEWTGGITASRPAQPGLLREGARVDRTARFLGRGFTYRYKVTAHEPGRMVELAVDRPFPMTVRYELADHPDGTLVAIHATGSPGRFFGWATPLLTRQVRASITADLRRLRDRLEQPNG
jgi:Polyketide cyclase / dehydrase and lipid transport